MKVLFIDLGPGLGGSLISLQRLLSRLDRTAFQPTMLLSVHNPAATTFRVELGVPVLAIPTVTADTVRESVLVKGVKRTAVGRRLRTGRHLSRLWAGMRAVRNVVTRTLPLTWRIYCAIRRVDPDLVHVNDAIFMYRPAVAAAWLARKPIVCHVRSLGRLSWLDRLWARAVTRFVFISRWVAADLAAQGIPTTRGQVIYDGIDVAPFQQMPDRAAARAILGLPLDRPIVAVLGRLVAWKGQDLFLRAMRQVADAVPGALGLIVGQPEVYSRDFGVALKELAAGLGLDEVVRFTGFVEDMETLLAGVDLLAHTSVSPEPFGLVMLEAMAAGLPVVTPAEGGGLDIVIDGVTGRLYEPRNPDALAAVIIDLLRQPATARAMGAAGRTRVAQVFSLEQFTTAMTDLYREVWRRPLGGELA